MARARDSIQLGDSGRSSRQDTDSTEYQHRWIQSVDFAQTGTKKYLIQRLDEPTPAPIPACPVLQRVLRRQALMQPCNLDQPSKQHARSNGKSIPPGQAWLAQWGPLTTPSGRSWWWSCGEERHTSTPSLSLVDSLHRQRAQKAQKGMAPSNKTGPSCRGEPQHRGICWGCRCREQV